LPEGARGSGGRGGGLIPRPTWRPISPSTPAPFGTPAWRASPSLSINDETAVSSPPEPATPNRAAGPEDPNATTVTGAVTGGAESPRLLPPQQPTPPQLGLPRARPSEERTTSRGQDPALARSPPPPPPLQRTNLLQEGLGLRPFRGKAPPPPTVLPLPVFQTTQFTIVTSWCHSAWSTTLTDDVSEAEDVLTGTSARSRSSITADA